jgi:hypothetical protein
MLRWMQPMELCRRLGELQGKESTIQIWILMDKLTVADKDETWNALSKLRQRGWFGACWCCLSRKATQCPALLLHRITIMQRCLWKGWFSTWPFPQCDVKSHALMHAGETVRMPLSGAQGAHTLYFSRALSPKKIHWSSPCTNTRAPPVVY